MQSSSLGVVSAVSAIFTIGGDLVGIGYDLECCQQLM